jgi:hypothetical protein
MSLNQKWLDSEEARRILGATGCELMHLRESGALGFQKAGNRFLYKDEDVTREAAKRRAHPEKIFQK